MRSAEGDDLWGTEHLLGQGLDLGHEGSVRERARHRAQHVALSEGRRPRGEPLGRQQSRGQVARTGRPRHAITALPEQLVDRAPGEAEIGGPLPPPAKECVVVDAVLLVLTGLQRRDLSCAGAAEPPLRQALLDLLPPLREGPAHGMRGQVPGRGV